MRRLWIFLQVLIALPLLAAGIALREGAETLEVWMQGLLALGLIGGAVVIVLYGRGWAPIWVRLGLRAGKALSEQGSARARAVHMSGEPNGEDRGTGPAGRDGRGTEGRAAGASGNGASGGGNGRGGNGSGGNGGCGNGGGQPPDDDGLPDDVNRLINAYLVRGEMFAQELVCPLESLADHVGRNPDQELWLQLVYGLNHDLPASHDCFLAMVRHPACENAVAAALLDQMQADYYYTLPPARARDLDPGAYQVIKAIGDRDGPQGFPATGIADSRRLDRAALRARFAELEPDPDSIRRLPWRLLMATPRGRSPRERYLVDETGVYRVT